MTCQDVFELWEKTHENVREYRGTTTLFTGHMAELLILRFLVHQLGGNLRRDTGLTKDVDSFVDESRGLAIFPNRRHSLGDGRYWRPDFSLYQAARLLAVVEVKTVISRASELANVEHKLDYLCRANDGTRGAFVHFHHLDVVNLSDARFRVISLNGNAAPLAARFDEALGLSDIVHTSAVRGQGIRDTRPIR